MKGRGGQKERKVRMDKKVDVKPTMSIKLKDLLYTFAYLCNEPVKDAAERLCVKGAESDFIIEKIRQWFRRNYYYKNSIVSGYLERPRLKITMQSETGKVTIKFPQASYDLLCKLAFSMDLTPTSTATVLIKMTLTNYNFMEEYIRYHLKHLEEKRIQEIRKLLKM